MMFLNLTGTRKLDFHNRYYHNIYYGVREYSVFDCGSCTAAIANYKTTFTSEILAGSGNANPVFVKRSLSNSPGEAGQNHRG